MIPTTSEMLYALVSHTDAITRHTQVDLVMRQGEGYRKLATGSYPDILALVKKLNGEED